MTIKYIKNDEYRRQREEIEDDLREELHHRMDEFEKLQKHFEAIKNNKSLLSVVGPTILKKMKVCISEQKRIQNELKRELAIDLLDFIESQQ